LAWISVAPTFGLAFLFHFLFDCRLGFSQNVEKRLEDRIEGASAPDGTDWQFAGRRSDWTENRLTVAHLANATRNERYTQAALHGENHGVHHFQLKRDLWQETCPTTSGDHFGIKRRCSSPIALDKDYGYEFTLEHPFRLSKKTACLLGAHSQKQLRVDSEFRDNASTNARTLRGFCLSASFKSYDPIAFIA